MKSNTTDLLNELTVRMSDWFEDPEPQHDECFANVNQTHLENAYHVLKNLNRQNRKQVAALLKKQE